ncbi:MAG: LacI family transcriptional regulator [Alphaproteobacteria bacterium]|nr:MAG: LacI family transcriptional regulator [Alphaproteobacteria bacterium]
MGAKTPADRGKNRTRPSKPGGRVTSYDVARHARVSQSAVSRAFKPGAHVSKKMRERVMKAARDLGYEPNAIARSLISGRSNLVAVIISNLTNLYYPEVLAQLSQRLSARGARVLLFTLESESQVDETLQQVFQYQVDGAIVAARLSREQVDEFAHRRVPLVFYNRFFRDFAVNAVCCDQVDGARQLVDGLARSGHRRFAVIAGPADSFVGIERTQTAVQSIRERGLDIVAVLDGDYSYDCAAPALAHLAAQAGGMPDAIICANDVMAIGAIDALRFNHGLAVPKDVSVVGFDGVGPARWSSFNLTTIRQPVRRMTEAAVSMLLEHVEDPERPPEKRLFTGQLMRGGSARLI